MGADLYRTGYEAIHEAHHPAWENAITARNLAFERATRAGTLEYAEGMIDFAPNVIAPDYAVAAQQAVDRLHEAMNPPSHYFRDPYNDSSLFWALDLSWWNDLEPFFGPNGDGVMTKITDEDGEDYEEPLLYPAGMRRLIATLEQRGRTLHTITDDEERIYFTAKLSRLTAFLHDAAEAGDTIYCSL